MTLGVMHLWQRDYEAATAHFDEFNRDHPQHASCIYAMSGTAKWCLDGAREAVNTWEAGVDCEYADVGLGVTIPLLLFFASVFEPQLCFKNETQKLLGLKCDDSRSRTWPGPLAHFILAHINEGQLRSECSDKTHGSVASRHLQADFYAGVIEYQKGNAAEFNDRVARISNVSWDDFDIDRNSFIRKLWTPEFYLARHEAFQVKDRAKATGSSR
jgi:hypothetical protein